MDEQDAHQRATSHLAQTLQPSQCHEKYDDPAIHCCCCGSSSFSPSLRPFTFSRAFILIYFKVRPDLFLAHFLSHWARIESCPARENLFDAIQSQTQFLFLALYVISSQQSCSDTDGQPFRWRKHPHKGSYGHPLGNPQIGPGDRGI